MMDVNEIAALLHIQKETRDQPSLKAIHDAAFLKLQEHNNTHVQAAPAQETPPTAGTLTLNADDESEDNAKSDTNATPATGRRV